MFSVKFQCIHSMPETKERTRVTHLQARKKCLKRVDPGVHDLSIKHVHIYIKRRVTFSFIASLSPVQNENKHTVLHNYFFSYIILFLTV